MKNLDALKQHGDVIWNIANLLRGPYLTDEVLPYRADAWIDHSKTKVGYEIAALEQDILAMLKDVTA